LNLDFINEFCGILDLGLKFIPSIFVNLNHFFLYYLFELDKSFIRLNSYIFFEKEKIRKKQQKKQKKDYTFIETILNSIRYSNNNINHNNIPLQEETLILRKKLFQNVTLARKFNHKTNLTIKQIDCIKKFFTEKPFSLCNSDKNVGWVCLDKSLYINLANDHLASNSFVYKKLNTNPLQETINKIIVSLSNLKDSGHISNRLFNLICPKVSSKLGKFKILAKLHKTKFGIRPIINSIGHPTEPLSNFLDKFLQPFIKTSESYIRDSQNVLQNCVNLKVKNNYFLYSCDFESLYTNINTEEAIYLISEYFKTRISPYILDFDIIGFNEILKLILYNNIFCFNNSYYLQINGLAMGGKCGPSIANIYIYIKEKDWLLSNMPHNIIIYNRFIDDIFIIAKYDIILSNFKSIFSNLILNIICGKEIQFLDLLISKNKYLESLSFKLYTKPTNTFQYLYYSSNHPLHIFHNIPKSLFIRNNRICDQHHNYLYYSRRLIKNLTKRGYEIISLIKLCLSIGNVDRKSLIPYKNKTLNLSKYTTDTFKFIINYDINYISLKKDFTNITMDLRKKFLWLKDFKFNLLYSTSDNLNTIFNNENFSLNKKILCKTTKCSLTDCVTCKFIYEKNYLRINNFFLPILNNCNCDSTNLVYIILCIKCNVFYIGQTSRKFSTRFREHIKNICTVKKQINTNSELCLHFNKTKHDLYTDLRFFIFKDSLADLHHRLSVETDLIHIFIALNLTVLNEKIASINYIKKLSFT